MTKAIWTDNGKNVALNRTYKTTPDYTVPSNMRLGVDQAEPFGVDTAITKPVPILDGTVNDDGNNQLTGANGGTNTTDNTTTYRPGAGVTDNVAQNLLSNGTSANKEWSISNLATNGTVITGARYMGFSIYIKDQTTLDYLTTSNCVEIRVGSDSSNYYYKQWDKADLQLGWNFLSTISTAVEDLTETGTVVGSIDYFYIKIVTNNAADSWSSADVIYDLLRTWQASDEINSIVSGYPSFDEANQRVTLRYYLNATQANGFDLSGLGIENTDTPPKVTDIEEFTDESKSDTDEIAFIVKNNAEQG